MLSSVQALGRDRGMTLQPPPLPKALMHLERALHGIECTAQRQLGDVTSVAPIQSLTDNNGCDVINHEMVPD